MSSYGFDPIATWKRDSVTDEGRTFPQTEVLNPAEGARVRAWLLDSTGLTCDSTNRTLLDVIYSTVRPLQGTNPEHDGFDFGRTLDEAEILSDTVLILLPLEGAFDSGVRLARRDLIDYFDDIWYPSTDDLLVIDEQLRNLLLVDHHGRVGITTLGKQPREDNEERERN